MYIVRRALQTNCARVSYVGLCNKAVFNIIGMHEKMDEVQLESNFVYYFHEIYEVNK
jgi:hypothetical protein